MLPCLVPSWPQIRKLMLTNHSLDFLSYLVLQACISFLRCFRQAWRVSVFALFAKNAVAHVILLGLLPVVVRTQRT